MHTRNPASVLPEPVGAAISVFLPAAISGQPSVWAGVGPSGNRRSNQARTAGWNALISLIWDLRFYQCRKNRCSLQLPFEQAPETPQLSGAADPTDAAVVLLAPILLRLEREHAAEDEQIVLSIAYLDAVRIGKADPRLGDRCDGVPVLGE